LDDSIFLETPSQTELIGLFDPGAVLQHRVMLMNQEPASAALAWIREQSPGLQKEIMDVLDDSCVLETRHPSSIIWTVTATDSAPDGVTIRQARQLMNQPLRIHVEDSTNDRAFLFSIMRREDREHLEECERENCLEFVHGGGTGLHTQIAALPMTESGNAKRLALFDSDALLPEKPSASSMRLMAACTERRIEALRLKRRAAENYLTKSQLYAWASTPRNDIGKRRLVDAFFGRMNHNQRAHFRMRTGWGDDRENDDYKRMQSDIDAFYESAATTPDWSLLERGFGKTIRSLFCVVSPREKELEASGISAEFSSFFATILSRL
jgi:hypothetical protein